MGGPEQDCVQEDETVDTGDVGLPDVVFSGKQLVVQDGLLLELWLTGLSLTLERTGLED